MCTAISYQTKNFYFGRTLDYECTYGEKVTVVPRNFPFTFRKEGEMKRHLAMIGMAHIANGHPLFYEAVNEAGLGCAGLNFPHDAHYFPAKEGKCNLAPYELIPYLLGNFRTLAEARPTLERLNLIDIPFSDGYPVTPLHFLLADKTGSVVIEQTEDGLKIYDNPVGVLTNSPPFNIQLFRLNDFMALSPKSPKNEFSSAVDLRAYSRGMGAMGLPGDMSSASRFVRAAFVRLNFRTDGSEEGSVSQFFHILGSVAQVDGCVKVENGYEKTVYTSCCNADKGVYYYTTYYNSAVHAVDMHRVDLDASELFAYPLMEKTEIFYQN